MTLNLGKRGCIGVFVLQSVSPLLLLIPALHRGAVSTLDNGTPWRWPIYPLAIFVVLAVLARDSIPCGMDVLWC